MKRNSFLIILFSLVLTACAAPTPTAALPTATPAAAETIATSVPVATEAPTLPPTEIPATPTEVVPHEGMTKTETLNGKEVLFTYHIVTDAEGKEVYRDWFRKLTTPNSFSWLAYKGIMPINLHLPENLPGANTIDSIAITQRNESPITAFDSVAAPIFLDSVNRSSMTHDEYVSGITDNDPTTVVRKYKIGVNEYTFSPNPNTGVDVWILPNQPEIVENHGFVPGFENGKIHIWTANFGNEENKSVRTAIVSKKPVDELTDAEWVEFLLLNATSLLEKQDQTTPFVIDSEYFASKILNDPNPFVKIIRVNSPISPTPTP